MSIRRFLPYAFWAALLIGFVVALWPKPVALPGNPSDKVQHILAFLGFAALGTLAFPRASLLKMGVALSAYGALIEFAQMIPALKRDGDVLDWIADTVAAASVLAVAGLVRRLR
jgi:VanZ family protein